MQTEPASIRDTGPAEVRDFDCAIDQRSECAPAVPLDDDDRRHLQRARAGDRHLRSCGRMAARSGWRISRCLVPAREKTAPYQRYYDTPERVLLTQQDTAQQSIPQWFPTEYPGCRRVPIDSTTS